jgi:hypothetical protein
MPLNINPQIAVGEAIAQVINSVLDRVGARGAKEEWVRKNTESGRKIFEDAAIEAAFSALGIKFDGADRVNASTVTQAINKTLLSGFDLQLENVFDIDVTKVQIEHYALKKINERLGGELRFKSLKKSDLKSAIKRYANIMVYRELVAGGGVIADSLGNSEAILKMIADYEAGQDLPLSTNPEAEGNRERQARYRQNHYRHWEH